MKKLKLNEYSTLANAEMLKIRGGYGGGSGAANCTDQPNDKCAAGLCAQIWQNGGFVNQYCKKSTNFSPITHDYYCYCSTSR